MNETDDPVVQINLLLPEGVMTERAKQLILLSVGQEGKELSFQVEISGRIMPTEEETCWDTQEPWGEDDWRPDAEEQDEGQVQRDRAPASWQEVMGGCFQFQLPRGSL